MKVVLDTNIVMASISRFSPYSLVLDTFRARQYQLCLTTDITLEYEEKLFEHFSPLVAQPFIESLSQRSNVEWVNVSFKWNLIYPDMDDNKFVDCAVAANADYLVTNDRDYNPLKKLPFPKLNILKIEEFMELLRV